MPIQICRLRHIYHIWRSSVQSTTLHIFHFTFPAFAVDLINTVHSRMSLFSANKQGHVGVTLKGDKTRGMQQSHVAGDEKHHGKTQKKKVRRHV